MRYYIELWFQRYYVHDESYKPGGPFIVLLNGQTYLNPDVVHSTVAVDLANETGAMLFALEHRYYGNSIPARCVNVSLDI